MVLLRLCSGAGIIATVVLLDKGLVDKTSDRARVLALLLVG